MNAERDDKLSAAARRLATEIRPQRDLWPEIEAAITQPAPQYARWMPRLAQAAAVLVIIGASSGVTWLAMKNDAPAPVQQFTPEYAFERAAFGSNYSLGADYLQAREEMMAKLQPELEKLAPAEREDVEKSLEVIRKAIGDINAALEQDPDNVLLQDLLMKTYREELHVMQKVSDVSRRVMSRSDI